MNALIVYPRFPVTYWGFQYTLRLIGKRAPLPPLGLITVAALLPSHWQLRLVDLNVQDVGDDGLRWADFVLTGGLLVQVDSIQESIARARTFEVPVAVGGPAPTTSPELFCDADVVFRGEAEGRIEELIDALSQRSEGRLVLEAPASRPDMTTVPVPRFDLLDMSEYASLSVQYSRGCPFQCEFCDIIEIFGRKPRVKTPDQVIDELEAIWRLGYKGTLFFVDDNFNFVPAMSEEALLRGYRELMAWLYSPNEYYDRCETYLRRVGSVSASRASTLGEMGALLRTIWHVGVRSSRRRLFWRLMGQALLRGRSKVRQAVVHAVQGEHLIRYTREHVVPRMELEEARAEVATGRIAPQIRDRTPKRFDSSTPDGSSRPAHRSSAPETHRPAVCEQPELARGLS